jgi:transposase
MTRDNRRRQLERKIVEYLMAGESLRWIVKKLKTGDRKVRRLREKAAEYGYLSGQVPLPPFPEAVFPDPIDGRSERENANEVLLLGKKDWLKERLSAGWRPITVFEELGLSVSRSAFYRFLHREQLYSLGETYRRVVPEIVHQPGESLLLDWGKLRDVIDAETGKKKTLWAFVGVLGFSRYLMVRLVWTNDIPTTLDAIETMLRELGGVPAKITSDNPKCFVTEASRYEPILNPALERFAQHHSFTVECLPPRDPQKKGKVERPMNYVRRLYEAHGSDWLGLEESQRYMDKKVALANERRHGTTLRRPIDDLLNVEVSALKPLPALAFEREEYAEGRVRKDGHFRFANKYYSLDEKYIGEDVFILANQKQVVVYFKGKSIEVHERLWDPYRSKQTKNHHKKPWEQAMQDDSIYRRRAAAIGPDVERMIVILLQQGNGFIDTRKIWGILSLDKVHSHEAINRACREAIQLQSFSYRTVKMLATLEPKLKESPEETNSAAHENKFVRPLSEYQKQLELLIN